MVKAQVEKTLNSLYIEKWEQVVKFAGAVGQ